MSDLVTELKNEHARIRELLLDLPNTFGDSIKIKRVLISLKEVIFSHLKKEDLELYPVLNKAAENDASLKNTLEIFAKDIPEISESIIQFFEKYMNQDITADYARDLSHIKSKLSNRILREEKVLYEEYRQIALWKKVF